MRRTDCFSVADNSETITQGPSLQKENTPGSQWRKVCPTLMMWSAEKERGAKGRNRNCCVSRGISWCLSNSPKAEPHDRWSTRKHLTDWHAPNESLHALDRALHLRSGT